MGVVCSSDKKGAKNKYKTEESDRVVSQPIHGIHHQDDAISGPDENLRFKVQIENIKARNLPSGATHVKINFAKQRQFSTSKETLYSSNFNWSMKEEFDFETTRHSLKKQTIELMLMDGYEKEMGNVVIKLHDIVTGPPEQDFPINLKSGAGKEVARLNFQVKMYQMIHMSIKTKQVTCKLNDGLREKNYNFSLKVKTKEGEYLSEHSEDVLNPNAIPGQAADTENYQYMMEECKNVKMKTFVANPMDIGEGKLERGITQENETLDAITADRTPSTSTSILTKSKIGQPGNLPNMKKEVGWDYKQVPDDGKSSSPCLEIDVNIRELVSGSFQFFLWTNKEPLNAVSMANKDQEDSEEVYIDHKLIAECYIGMNKFFFGQAEINFGEDSMKLPGQEEENKGSKGKKGQDRQLNFNEKLWFNGVTIGDMIGEFTLFNTSFYKQMIMGVRNEGGIQKISSMYNLSKESSAVGFAKNPDTKEMKVLETQKDNFKTLLFNLSNQKLAPKMRGQYLADLKELLFKISENLRNLNQNVALSYVDNHENLLTSQNILVHLGRNLFEGVEEIILTVRPWCFDAMTVLINRGEFDLNFMGFTGAYANYIKNPKAQTKITDKLFQRKVEVCQGYQMVLYQMLKRTVNKLNDKSLPEKEKDFVENFSAQAYFRIPEYREKILEQIGKEDGKVALQEWRGADWGLDDKIDPTKKNQYFVSLFDWEKDFYSYLRTTEQGKKNYEVLQKILDNKDWQEKISKKGVSFYLFLTEWANQVDRTVIIKEHVPWHDIPGYTVLLKSFLLDLKTKDVRQYPEAMVEASCALLRNEKLFNTFVSILYRNTRLYDSSNVFAVYELINKWFTVLTENGKSIHSTFDYGFFFKGLFMVMDGEHALNIAIALLVIYNNFNLFPSSEKAVFTEYLLNKGFFRLFLHWSWSVRQVFHHLLLYRFYHQHRNTNTNLTNLEDLRKEFLLYNQKRELQDKSKTLLLNDYINMTYARNMTIIENAYNKYTEEKKSQALQKKFKAKVKPMPKLRYASAVNLGNLVNPEDLKDNNTQTTQTTGAGGKGEKEAQKQQDGVNKGNKQGTGSGNQEYNPHMDPNCIIINPDKLESTTSTQHLGIRPTRSESVSLLTEEFVRGNGAGNENLNANVKDAKNLQGGEGKYERVTEKKKVIHRRFMYFDKQTNELKEIPKEYIVYLQTSYEEFEKTKEAYLKWIIGNQPYGGMNLKPNELKVPELIVKIPLDENEENRIEPEDW